MIKLKPVTQDNLFALRQQVIMWLINHKVKSPNDISMQNPYLQDSDTMLDLVEMLFNESYYEKV